MDIIITVILWAGLGTVLGLLAKRKNLNPWLWGVIGGFPYFIIIGAIALACTPFRCPKCQRSLTNKEWKGRSCPICGIVAAQTK